ncbi:ficolin-2-like isoform X1 [Saccostrea cucullata]|uniref:ficolin-2-like isoform X1 n=1 Tax=Saccostrea cuccullata TaxID=36930 RepID=UPI002ED0F1D0
MSNLLAVIFIAAYFTVPLGSMFSRRYTRSMDFDNKKSEQELLGEYVISFKDCAEKCRGDCGVFGYNEGLKKCRLHRKLHRSSTSDEEGWRYFFHDFLATDCQDLLDKGHINSGVYDIYPFRIPSIPVKVFCDLTTMGGGWTAIQKRIDGSVTFDRNWTDYKNGFGSPETEVWIGNDVIHQLTKENTSSLYVSITLPNGTNLYEMYGGFSVSDEAGKYQLFLTGPATGTLGDRMLDTGSPDNYDLSGMFFSTPDNDNDGWSGGHCAASFDTRGGWWFRSCHSALLNGPWSPRSWGWPWYPAVMTETSVRGTKMMIKRH